MAIGTENKTGATILNLVYDTVNHALNVVTTALGLASDATQNDPVTDTITQISHEAKDFDGAALPNSVDEGDATRPASTKHGVTYSMPVNEDGSKSPINLSGYMDVEIQADNAGLATESGGNLDTIAGDTTGLNTKEGTTGEASDVDGTRAAQLRYVGETIETARVLLATIDADTGSLDGKTPTLGTAAMAAASPMTIATDDTQFGVVGEAASSTGGVHAQLRDIADSVDSVASDVSLPPATHTSPEDFIAAFTTDVTITLTGHPTITDNSQIAYIVYIPTGGSGAGRLINGQNGVTLTEAAGVITVNGGGTPFTASDEYQVGLKLQDKGYDDTNDVIKNIKQNLDRGDYTDAVAYTTFTPDDVTYDDGAVLTLISAKTLTLYWSKTASTNDANNIKLIGLTAAAGSPDYQELSAGSPVGGRVLLASNVYEVPKAADVNFYVFDVSGLNFGRFDIAKATDDAPGSDATFTTYVSYGY